MAEPATNLHSIRGGWRYGETRDNERKLHPDIVPWEELSEEAKNKDREPVKEIGPLLAQAGFSVVRG